MGRGGVDLDGPLARLLAEVRVLDERLADGVLVLEEGLEHRVVRGPADAHPPAQRRPALRLEEFPSLPAAPLDDVLGSGSGQALIACLITRLRRWRLHQKRRLLRERDPSAAPAALRAASMRVANEGWLVLRHLCPPHGPHPHRRRPPRPHHHRQLPSHGFTFPYFQRTGMRMEGCRRGLGVPGGGGGHLRLRLRLRHRLHRGAEGRQLPLRQLQPPVPHHGQRGHGPLDHVLHCRGLRVPHGARGRVRLGA